MVSTMGSKHTANLEAEWVQVGSETTVSMYTRDQAVV